MGTAEVQRVSSGSPCATLFITVLFLQQLTENLQYQRVIKDQAVPGAPEAASSHISALGVIRGPHYLLWSCRNSCRRMVMDMNVVFRL
jgi:hypothetical protein